MNVDYSRDDLLTSFSKDTLADRYLLKDADGKPAEKPQDLFVRVSTAYGDDEAHAQRIYDYISKLWFMPATPVLSNGGTKRGLPISCFLNEVQDSMRDIMGVWQENGWLASKGGGIGTYWGNVRSLGETVGGVGKTSGIVPFIKVMDSQTLAISQGSLRRGSAAVYLDVNHPEIEEFVEIRRPTGGDPNRRCLNIHHGVVVPDSFMLAVKEDADWALISPADGAVIKTVKARGLWQRILTARVETGEPYLLFSDAVNKAIPEFHKAAGLTVKSSNLCSEITLATSEERTAVCCLSSLNLEKYQEWTGNAQFYEDVMRFLDNVLQDFIDRAPDEMHRAVFSASQERSVGLGVMGFHGFLQGMGVAFESVMAKTWNKKIFTEIHQHVRNANHDLGVERGPCPDAAGTDCKHRFANATAIAPTASISIIAGASPSVEPVVANSFTHKTLSGSFQVKNKYLEAVLEVHGKNNRSVWASINTQGGSVQHLDFLTENEKAVFKTAFELDQRWIVELAADRTPYIDQSQSINLFFAGDAHKRTINAVHLQAWEKGLKSLYYCRSRSVQRAETEQTKVAPPVASQEECLACQ